MPDAANIDCYDRIGGVRHSDVRCFAARLQMGCGTEYNVDVPTDNAF